MKKLFLGISLLAMLPVGAKRLPVTKIADLKRSVRQLMSDPVKNENQIRKTLEQLKPYDAPWVSTTMDELESALSTKNLPRVLPGVPTPREYMPIKEEPALVTPSEEAYEKPPAYEPTLPAREIPEEEAPAYEESYYAHPPAAEIPPVEEAPAYNPPAYEARAKQISKQTTRKVTQHSRNKQLHIS